MCRGAPAHAAACPCGASPRARAGGGGPIWAGARRPPRAPRGQSRFSAPASPARARARATGRRAAPGLRQPLSRARVGAHAAAWAAGGPLHIKYAHIKYFNGTGASVSSHIGDRDTGQTTVQGGIKSVRTRCLAAQISCTCCATNWVTGAVTRRRRPLLASARSRRRRANPTPQRTGTRPRRSRRGRCTRPTWSPPPST